MVNPDHQFKLCVPIFGSANAVATTAAEPKAKISVACLGFR